MSSVFVTLTNCVAGGTVFSLHLRAARQSRQRYWWKVQRRLLRGYSQEGDRQRGGSDGRRATKGMGQRQLWPARAAVLCEWWCEAAGCEGRTCARLHSRAADPHTEAGESTTSTTAAAAAAGVSPCRVRERAA